MAWLTDHESYFSTSYSLRQLPGRYMYREGEGEGEGKVHPRTGQEVPEGE